jgi:L-threonylcarbamoyladenylate synthase
MTTLRLSATSPDDLTRAATLLRDGRLVAFATETVYGLGANALSADAVANIFTAKQRPSWDPLIVHLASAAQLPAITSIPADLLPRIETLAAAFWPGPLTLLLPRNASIPDAVTSGRPLVGVRIPAHPTAQALLAAAGIPVAAPSANLFGHTSPTTAAHVLADLDGRIDAVLDAGPTTVGLESTVLDPTQTPMILYRPGAVTPDQLTAATGVPVSIYQPPATREPAASLPSPGVGIRHYAPRATLILTGPTQAALQNAVLLSEKSLLSPLNSDPETPTKLGILLPTGWQIDHPALIEPWADFDDSAALAAKLFAALRSLDERGAALILCPMPAPGGFRDAIRDRLQKAARPSENSSAD